MLHGPSTTVRTRARRDTHEPAAAAHCKHVFVIRDGIVAGGFDTKGMHASDLVVRASGLGSETR